LFQTGEEIVVDVNVWVERWSLVLTGLSTAAAVGCWG